MISFYASAKHSCEIKDGKVVCSGDNYYGQCDVPELKNPRQVVAGDDYTCALDDDGVKCWGDNHSGQTNVPLLRKVSEIFSHDDPYSYDDHTFCAIDESLVGVKRKVCWGSLDKVEILFPSLDQFSNIVKGEYHECGFYKGIAECWGKNNFWQVDVPPLENPKQFAFGSEHTCALDDNGVKCWGNSWYGQTNVPYLLKVLEISATGDNSCAIDESPTGVRRIVCWGSKRTIEILSPSLDQFTNIVSGKGHQCGLNKGLVECWGDSEYGQAYVPYLRKVLEIFVSDNTSCAVDESTVGVRRKVCWGQEGNIVEILSPSLDQFKNIIKQSSYQCGFYQGSLECWGNNNYGQANAPFLNNLRQFAFGSEHTCALDDNGVKCWGSNSNGQTDVPTLKNPKQIAAGKEHNCALDDDGVKCWGKNADFLDSNNSDSEVLALGAKNGFFKISRDDNVGITNLSEIFPMFLSYVFKNELRFFYSFDKIFGEKLFKILSPGSKYLKLMVLLHTELKKGMGLADTDEKYRFLWNKGIYLPYDHEFLTEPSAPENGEERKQLLNVLVESIKTTMPLMSDEYKQRASGIILKLVNSLSAVTLDEVAEFVSDAGINPYIRPRVKLQMELIRLLGL